MENQCFWYSKLHSSPKKNMGVRILRLLPLALFVVGIILIPRFTQNSSIYQKLIPFFVMCFGMFGILLLIALNPIGRKRFMVVLDRDNKLWIEDTFTDHFLHPFALMDYQPFLRRSRGRYTNIIQFIVDIVRYNQLQKKLLERAVPEKVRENPERALTAVKSIPTIVKGDFYFRITYLTEDGRNRAAVFYNDIDNYEDLLEICDNYTEGMELRKESNRRQIGILLLVLGAILFVASFVVSIELKIMALNLITFFGSVFLMGLGVGFIKQG